MCSVWCSVCIVCLIFCVDFMDLICGIWSIWLCIIHGACEMYGVCGMCMMFRRHGLMTSMGLSCCVCT